MVESGSWRMGVFARILEALAERSRGALLIDSSIDRAHQHTAREKRKRGSRHRSLPRRPDNQDPSGGGRSRVAASTALDPPLGLVQDHRAGACRAARSDRDVVGDRGCLAGSLNAALKATMMNTAYGSPLSCGSSGRHRKGFSRRSREPNSSAFVEKGPA